MGLFSWFSILFCINLQVISLPAPCNSDTYTVSTGISCAKHAQARRNPQPVYPVSPSAPPHG